MTRANAHDRLRGTPVTTTLRSDARMVPNVDGTENAGVRPDGHATADLRMADLRSSGVPPKRRPCIEDFPSPTVAVSPVAVPILVDDHPAADADVDPVTNGRVEQSAPSLKSRAKRAGHPVSHTA
jgi:hypothetical protein